jgi:hypothetical protein
VFLLVSALDGGDDVEVAVEGGVSGGDGVDDHRLDAEFTERIDMI